MIHIMLNYTGKHNHTAGEIRVYSLKLKVNINYLKTYYQYHQINIYLAIIIIIIITIIIIIIMTLKIVIGNPGIYTIRLKLNTFGN